MPPTATQPALTPEEARACGMGLGEGCCVFLAMHGPKFVCGREMNTLRQSILAQVEDMRANHVPADESIFPECQP